ncbi:MAG: MIP family channel protein [Actinomycetes bacterium]
MAFGKKLGAEFLGTAILVFFACGVATLSFGKGFNFSNGIVAAGVVATSLAFGLVLLGLIYTIGSVSGCHVNPAVTIGALVAGRISIVEAIGYWVAQFAGGIAGALLLWSVFSGSPLYRRQITGLGADGYGANSMTRIDMGHAFLVEVILTAVFIFVILAVTSKVGNAVTAGVAIGLTLTFVHLVGIPLTGTSVNPARSFGPALVVGGSALHQVWLFIVAPLVGGIVGALAHIGIFGRNSAEEAPAAA